MFIVVYNAIEAKTSGFSIQNLWIVVLFLNLFVLSLGISLILSNIYILAKDITQIWAVFTSFLFFLSPIFYKLETFRAALPSFEYGNPISGIIINARRAMMEGKGPDMKLLVFDWGYAIFFLLLGFILLNKLGALAAEKL